MAHAQKPDFVFQRNRRVHLNQRGHQFSWLLAAEVCASVVVMLDTPCSEVVWRVLATHSIRQFLLHFPSHASPCAITFQLESTLTDTQFRRGWDVHYCVFPYQHSDVALCDQKWKFIHSIGMCRMRRFLAVLRSFFHPSLLCNFSCTLLHQLVFHPPSLHLAICFLVCLSILLFPNAYRCIILFWEFYFLPFSVHVQTNIIYLTLLSLL